MSSATLERSEGDPIEKLATSIYPMFALLTQIQLDLFTLLKDGPPYEE